MKGIPKSSFYAYLMGLFLFVGGLLLPYITCLSQRPRNERSIDFGYDTGYFVTTLNAFEFPLGVLSVIIVVLISLIFFLTRKRWFKFLLIPIGIIYGLSQLMVWISTLAGFGAPAGDSLESGFYLMFIGTFIVFVTTAAKPILPGKNDRSIDDF